MPRKSVDPAVMRAVAHPLRLAILAEMWDADRPLRAADLAEALGEPANSVSYHIRRLRDAGYVVDVEGPEGGTARDHWYASPQRAASDAAQSASDPAAGAADADDDDDEIVNAALRTRANQVIEHVIRARAAEEGPLVHVNGMIWMPTDLARTYVRRLADLARVMRAAEAARRSAEPGTAFTRYAFATDLVPETRRGARLEVPVERTPGRDDEEETPEAV